jgi:hypothetical protein
MDNEREKLESIWHNTELYLFLLGEDGIQELEDSIIKQVTNSDHLLLEAITNYQRFKRKFNQS